MELREYIEAGSEKAGSLTALGWKLGVSQPNMSHAKAGRKPLPTSAIVQLAEFIGADLRAVIAANELVSEKDAAKRDFWKPYLQHAKAAAIAGLVIVSIFFVTPPNADASPNLSVDMGRFVLC